MNNSSKKPIIGIMGGIGSGKSVVANELAKLGCKIIDADKIAHQLLSKTEIKEKIVRSFGKSVLNNKNEIERSKLAKIVFSNIKNLTTINDILHPPVLKKTSVLIEQFNKEPKVKAIVLDMPLLLEVGWEKHCDKLIFVDCVEKIRAERIKKLGIFSENELKTREKFQIPLDNKAGIADNIVDNNSGLSVLTRQVAEIFSCIMESC